MNRIDTLPEVRLISITPDAQHTIAYCARVSNPSNQDNDNIAGLLAYCARKEHWSIFEMASAVLEIKTTRTVARQILRHRSFSFQEFSQRYGEVEEYSNAAARRQDLKNRQNSIDNLYDQDTQWWAETQREVIELVESRYQEALLRGIAKECARAILPEGMTITRMYMNGTIRSWVTYLKTRLAGGTQKEHRDVAEKIADIFRLELPTVAEAFNNFEGDFLK